MTQDSLLACRPVSDGLGVFALKAIKTGRHLLRFTGPELDREALDAALQGGGVDSFLQIAPGRYIGPSGGMDDFVNHSCNPNCGLQFFRSRIVLTAIRPIRPEEQLTFDYASTQNAYPYRFCCECGSAECRKDIGDFDDLPHALKWQYHERGILAPYLAACLIADAGLHNTVSMQAYKPVPLRINGRQRLNGARKRV